jgi:hypothetical protein
MLHNFIKPAFDADTLQVPSPLIQWLTRRLNMLATFRAATFVVFHTSEVNYLHLNTGAIRDLAGQLSSLIPGGKGFPADLGLIGIPYSQASALFLNCLIPHEIGHYAYQETTAINRLLPHVANSISSVLLPKIASVTPSDIQKCLARIQSWAQELFCDLFAIWMIGPAYSYAYIEIFDLPRVLSPDGKAMDLECGFNASHPSHIFRLQQQIELLKQLGWWRHIVKTKSHYSEVLQAIMNVDVSKFGFSLPENTSLGTDTLASFLLLCPHIHDVVTATVSGLDSGVHGFEEYQKDIQKYLSRAVVPSSLVHNGVLCHPDPVAIINASYGLYLEALDDLIIHVEGQDSTSVRVRGQWTDRLELWTMKAIEDYGLLINQATV